MCDGLLNEYVQEAKLSGCRNILALRGDPPSDKEQWEAVEGGFVHGVDLVRYIRRNYGDYFEIAVAGFPQNMLLPPHERDQEIQWLKEKIDAGCNLIFTQMFYDVEIFINWVKAVRAAGITVPIVPGIAPIQTWRGFERATSLAKTVIPQSWLDVLEPIKNDDEKVREVGVTLVAELCRRILKEDIGIRGLHFYTMNLERATKMLLEELNLVPRVETIKPLPWRQVCYTRYSARDCGLTDMHTVSYAEQETGKHPSNLLGESHTILHRANRELGRVPQRTIRRLSQSRIRRARRVWRLDKTNGTSTAIASPHLVPDSLSPYRKRKDYRSGVIQRLSPTYPNSFRDSVSQIFPVCHGVTSRPRPKCSRLGSSLRG